MSGLDCSEKSASLHERGDSKAHWLSTCTLVCPQSQVHAVKPGLECCSACPFHSLRRCSKSSVGLCEMAVLFSDVPLGMFFILQCQQLR